VAQGAGKVIGWTWAVPATRARPGQLVVRRARECLAARYDEASALEILEGPRELVPFATSRLVMAGFSDPLVYRDVRCRVLEDRGGTLILPMRRPHDLGATIRLCPSLPGTRVALLVNGRTALEASLSAGWQNRAFRVPSSWLHAGMNYVSLLQEQPAAPTSRSYAVGRTGVSIPVELTVESAGFPSGNRAGSTSDGSSSPVRTAVSTSR